MNKLQRLKSEIQRLPEKQKLANLVGVLEKYNTQTTTTLEVLTQIRDGIANVKLVSPEIDLKIVNEKIDLVAKTAQRLHKSLSENIENIKNADDKIFTIDSTAKNVSNTLRDKWRTLLQIKVETYEKIVKAAVGAKLSGSETLTQTLDKIRTRAESIPISKEKAGKIADEINSVSNAVKTLGLEGRIGDFLTAAADGNAAAIQLLDAEVQQFIEKNELWSVLSVKLG